MDSELRADCARCFALCCVAPAFSASADFAINKPAGHACPHLRSFRCSIHDRLRQRGFPGCTVYDCFGAGQKIAQLTFGGRDWRRHPSLAEPIFAAFAIMRDLHELLWYLTEALGLPAAGPMRPELRRILSDTERITRGAPDELIALDIAAHRSAVNAVLLRASSLARAGTPNADLRGAELIGQDLGGADLRGANLRGARLIGANLRRADLRLADLTGADLRGTVLHGADLGTALFLTQAQLDSALGDAATVLPPARARPAHWSDRPS